MQTFTTVIAALAAINAVSAAPLVARNTCGQAPAGTGSQTPIATPSNCETASACQTACNANGQCQSFLFGMVDNVIKCQLFAVPAAQVPKQATNLIIYDKACTSVPAVTPTSANPTGINQGGSTNNNPTGQNGQNGQTGQQTGQNGQSGQTGQQGQQSGQTPATGGHRLTVRDTCGGTPAGSNPSQAPLSQPSNINSAPDCLAKCKADPSCKAFEFGTENNAKVCRLFAVPAAQVPPPTSGQSFQVYDAGCSL